MSKLIWDALDERFFKAGVEKAVLYPYANGAYTTGVAWNGVTGIGDKPSGAEASPFYADGIKYLNIIGREDYGGSIKAYTYPDEFGECDGSASVAEGVIVRQQTRKPFGLSYVTRNGDFEEGIDYGYTIHLIYNAVAAPSEVEYATIGESTEPIELSWEFKTTPVEMTGFKPTSVIEIDSNKVDATKLAALEALLYGTDSEEASLPTPNEIATMFASAQGN